tara:strand:+ start:352 stop:849 length:498 start_codon:yes stop_codon:yes gene_type:complete
MTIEDLSDISDLLNKMEGVIPVYSKPLLNPYNSDVIVGLLEDVGTEHEGYAYEYLNSHESDDGARTYKLCSINNGNSRAKTFEIKRDESNLLCSTFHMSTLFSDIQKSAADFAFILAMAEHIKKYPEEYKNMRSIVNHKSLINKMLDKPNFNLRDHIDLLDFASE